LSNIGWNYFHFFCP